MNLNQYIEKLLILRDQCKFELPKDYFDEIAIYWFNEIAVQKAMEYGNECWERLGPRAFVVNTSAVFYRWKQLMMGKHTRESRLMRNALLDSFGFSMIFHVCLDTDIHWPPNLHFSPKHDDEYLIKMMWDGDRVEKDFAWVSLRQSYNMWKLTPNG